ncbi:phosphotransferase family enzyme [Sinobacterium caligoides]|uniref:Phosphotransferase family enzyme n=1 Tax=Sinobacterium caligoides TaxID=933926 RepID=A0A3N2DYK7_9GAMM|nr:aminoglycoside phosphotransferase family protein [Sinobacterium caligoides]ROS04857.1 phosphotransferase family enzyme [Sinobacterium caligoides]
MKQLVQQELLAKLSAMGVRNIVSLSALELGQSNSVYQCQTQHASYFVKSLDVLSSAESVAKTRALELWASEQGFGLAAIQVSEDGYLWIYPWCDRGDLLGKGLAKQDSLRQIASLISVVSRSKCPSSVLSQLQPLATGADLLRYRRRIEHCTEITASILRLISWEDAEGLASAMACWQGNEPESHLSVCHNDISLANVLTDDRGGVLIDWEYASLGTVEQELAFSSVILSLDHDDYLRLCGYLQSDYKRTLKPKGLQLWRRYALWINLLWCVEQAQLLGGVGRRAERLLLAAEHCRTKISVECKFTVDLYS